jgi:predicted  nucleic acid-binding Zn-ribbon protein
LSQVLDLLTLQTLDDEAAALQAALAEAERRLHSDEQLNEARRNFAATDEEVNDLRKQQRQLDAEIQDFNARIEPEEKRLYSGSVTNSKELQNIQHEVDALKAQRAKREDALLEALSQLEGAEGDRTEAQQLMEQHEARRVREVGALETEVARLNEAITRAQAKRMAQAAKVERPVVALYEDLRRRRGGDVIVRIQGSACSGCRVRLPETIRRRAMSAQLAQCPNCERILAVA